MKKNITTIAMVLAGLTFPLSAQASPAEILKDGKLYGDIRYRYEHVDDDAFVKDSGASTIRTKLGYTTAEYQNFQGSAELEWVENIGTRRHNDMVNGKGSYPVIADPTIFNLNELWLSYKGVPDSSAKIGRQRINLDNQRFVGAVGWRQNDQVFDSVVLQNSALPKTTVFYSYIDRVHRIFSRHNPLGESGSKTHLGQISYNHAAWLKATAYGYLIDMDRLPGLASKTYGLRLTGDIPLQKHDFTLFYEAEAATQSDYGRNPANYREDYYHAALGVKQGGLSVKAGFESLGGNGVNALQTPLATLHAHNGWADKFLATPVMGLEDFYGKISYKIGEKGKAFAGTKIDFHLHRFGPESGSGFYGSEWDAQITRDFDLPEGMGLKKYSLGLKFSDYHAKGLFADTQKIWLTIGTKF
ncbi:MAG: alginate export family protein [Pseudomonadota bacterium]|nr:MAG: alginate export family protein [Pseudomonadota bacterium]